MGEYSSGMNRKGVLKVIELQLKIELSDFPCLSNTLYFNHEMLECNSAGKETCVELQWQGTDILFLKVCCRFLEIIRCQLHTCTWHLN